MQKILVSDNGTQYRVDIDQGVKTGCVEIVRKLMAGDVFIHRSGGRSPNPFLLVQVIYENGNAWQLLGLGGCAPNSNNFFHQLHTIEEIEDYLRKNNMVFSHNILSEIHNLMYSQTRSDA